MPFLGCLLLKGENLNYLEKNKTKIHSSKFPKIPGQRLYIPAPRLRLLLLKFLAGLPLIDDTGREHTVENIAAALGLNRRALYKWIPNCVSGSVIGRKRGLRSDKIVFEALGLGSSFGVSAKRASIISATGWAARTLCSQIAPKFVNDSIAFLADCLPFIVADERFSAAEIWQCLWVAKARWIPDERNLKCQNFTVSEAALYRCDVIEEITELKYYDQRLDVISVQWGDSPTPRALVRTNHNNTKERNYLRGYLIASPHINTIFWDQIFTWEEVSYV